MELRNIKLTIEYDGTDFKGWQIQKKGERTVQEEIKKAIKKIFNQDVALIGSGRTDSGVHAAGQVANFKIRTKMPAEEIQKALNGNIGNDISIIKAEEKTLKFHSRYDAKSKIYRYSILNRKPRCAINRHYCLHYPYKLNLAAIRRESKNLIGKHDFKAFKASDPSRKNYKNTTRTIKNIKIIKRKDYIFIDIEANGFLYKMMRNIVGTLLEVGKGKIPQGSVKRILKDENRNMAKNTVKAHGLCLMEVKYKK